ncbi:MAG: glycosyltransferase family 2 protein [Chitinophagaceae bacterium]|jgi:glycosyltransferase involved in cell wall biosynthesis
MVSVLMTSYNRANFIKEAIESVLLQDYTDFELIIVDDSSSDATWDIIKAYANIDKRIKAFRNIENLGDYPNRNRVASYASRKYLKYLDSDDILLPGSLMQMVTTMEENPSCVLGLIGIGLELATNEYKILQPKYVYRDIFFKGKIIGCGPSFSIIKRSVFEEVGGFSEKRHLSDLELWFKLLPVYPLCVFGEGLVYWRRHNDQEFEIGEKSNFHFFKSYVIYLNALQQENCPLSLQERKMAIRNLKNRYSRHVLKNLSQGKVNFAASILRETSIRISDICQSVLPNRYPVY